MHPGPPDLNVFRPAPGPNGARGPSGPPPRAIAAALVCAALLTVAVKPRDGEKLPLAEAGRHILYLAGEDQRIATWLTPRIPYYARGENVKLNRISTWREDLSEHADWLAYVPERLDEKTLRALRSAAEGRSVLEFGSGTWRVCVVKL